MKGRIHIVLLLAGFGFSAQAQVRVDKPIDLNGASATDRQVIGLHDGVDAADALNARTLQRGAYLFAEVTGGSDWQANVQPAITQPQAGLCLLLRSADANTGAVTLSVNGSAPIAVLKEGDEQLQPGAIGAGETVSVVHDGNAFQLVSARRMDRKPCPSGTVEVNELYCIETQERDTLMFDVAAVTCAQQGMRLCTWGQWYAACTQATLLGLQNMTGEWEWTNSSANSDESARIVGYSSCTHAGIASAWGDSALPRNYRCCFNR
jgi:hypothetical protein